jgi:hypothetical protein
MQTRDALAALEAGHAAFTNGRTARATELFERALAAADADASLPRDSMLVAEVLDDVILARIRNAELSLLPVEGALQASPVEAQATRAAAWRAEPRALALSQRALALLLARFNAGTLFAPLTPVEHDATPPMFRAHRENVNDPDTLTLERAYLYIIVAGDAAAWWPPLREPAAEEARLRGVAGALRALVVIFEHGLPAREQSGQRVPGMRVLFDATEPLLRFLTCALDSELLRKLRAGELISSEEENVLAQRVLPTAYEAAREGHDASLTIRKAHLRRSVADVSRHGLRTCALPGCGATEPQPKTFKVCSRCRKAAYCSAAHQTQDWRRHKRADACAAAPQ